MPRKILIFSLVYYPRFIGGAEVALKEITDRIFANEYEFDMITLRIDESLPADERVGNIHVHRIGFSCGNDESSKKYKRLLALNKYLYPFMAVWKAMQLQRKRNYDAQWALMANYAGFAALLFKWMFPKVPFILTLQEGDPFAHIKKRVGIFYPFYRAIFYKADRVQAISHYLADFAKKMGHQGEVQVVPNGVDTKSFAVRLSDTEAFALKESLGKKYCDYFIITTSRLVKKNGVDILIRSLAELPQEVFLLIAGEGSEEGALRKIAKDLGVEERVKFLGFVPYVDLPKYLQVSDVFARPSRSEGFGNSFIEAMAAGIPVIATPVGGIVDFLFDPEQNPKMKSTGLFVQTENPKSLAEAVQKIIKNQALRGNLVENARELVVEKYDWDTVAADMKNRVLEIHGKN